MWVVFIFWVLWIVLVWSICVQEAVCSFKICLLLWPVSLSRYLSPGLCGRLEWCRAGSFHLSAWFYCVPFPKCQQLEQLWVPFPLTLAGVPFSRFVIGKVWATLPFYRILVCGFNHLKMQSVLGKWHLYWACKDLFLSFSQMQCSITTVTWHLHVLLHDPGKVCEDMRRFCANTVIFWGTYLNTCRLVYTRVTNWSVMVKALCMWVT